VADYDIELRKLIKASKSLVEDQGMVSRRNARDKVLAGLKKCRKALDESYPCIRRKPKRTGRLSERGRTRRLRSEGYVALTPPGRHNSNPAVGFCIGHKIPTYTHKKTTWVPKWVIDGLLLKISRTRMREMVTDPYKRAGYLTEARLGQKQDE
jgi:hypothetical protein